MAATSSRSPSFSSSSFSLPTPPLDDFHELYRHHLAPTQPHLVISFTLSSTLLIFVLTACFLARPRPIYLVDFACYKPEGRLMVIQQLFLKKSIVVGSFISPKPSSSSSAGSLKGPALVTPPISPLHPQGSPQSVHGEGEK
ncbi:hypothetical protein Cni_G05754 [Canna indica]|uniref:Very-long-chain 3-oxoacyl-CoA synthase n=1 Tax=Canna indica TaxID=4628 RepID=A0AAQ3JYA3_9LILI|nr:hypothetical protein Cni_G05754 [Canna indica]